MKPAKFAYMHAASVDEALSALGEYGGEAKLISGGQSLGPLLNMRLSQPAVLIDIHRVEELREASASHGAVTYGAAVRHADVEDERVPDASRGLMTAAARGIGYRAIRNRGTLGGSLAHADASAEWPLVLSALHATAHVVSVDGSRTVPVDSFVTGFFTSALSDNELLHSIEVSRLPGNSTWGLSKFTRKVGEFAESLAVVLLEWARGREAAPPLRASAWLGAAKSTPLQLAGVERLLVDSGRPGADGQFAEQLTGAVRTSLGSPVSPEERYQHHLHAVSLQRAVRDALDWRSRELNDPA